MASPSRSSSDASHTISAFLANFFKRMFAVDTDTEAFAQHFFLARCESLKHFERFLKLNKFQLALRNTISLSLYSLIAGFPLLA